MDLEKQLKIRTEERNIIGDAFNDLVEKCRLSAINIAEGNKTYEQAFDELSYYVEDKVQQTQNKLNYVDA